MHYEYETGNCDYVSYEYHCEVVAERDKRINQLEHEIEDLKQQHLETIEESQKASEGILVNEK